MRSAATEADRDVEAGLALVPRLPDRPDRQILELSLQLARANALLQLKGFAALETLAALTVAKQLLDAGVGTDLQRFSVLYGLCFASYMAARMEPALALARQIVELANRQDDTIYQLVGHRLVGTIQVWMGRSREALESLQQCERYTNPARQKQLSYRFRNRSRPCRPLLQEAGVAVPRPPRSGGACTEQVRASCQATDTPLLWRCATVPPWYGISCPAILRRANATASELVTYCAEKKVEIWRSLGVLYPACARATREPTEENIAALRTAIDARHPSGARQSDSVFISHLAEASLMAGDLAGAEAALREAFAFVEQSGERNWLADLHRVEGQIALKKREPDRTRAEACFLQAVEIARGQEARMLELRASTDLARLWRDTGSPNDARALLEPILAAIEGGESTRDVRAARVLLAEIA